MRRQTRWVFAVLAVVFAGSFVFLGVGSGGSALTDFLNGNIHLFGSGGGPSEKSLEQKVAKDKTNSKLRLQLAQLFAKNNHYDQAIAAYGAYLKMKPTDTTAMNELGTVYAGKVQELQSAVQSPPAPPLAAINGVSPIASNSVLGTAISTLTPTELGPTVLQAGEQTQLQVLLNTAIYQHVGVYLRIAKLTPGDSSAFLAAANTAGTDGDITLQIKMYQQFVAKYPTDPLTPDVKRNIKKLEKQLKSGQTTSPTTSGTTGSTG
jgi:tetratricopeptide (TPR) repeat protein